MPAAMVSPSGEIAAERTSASVAFNVAYSFSVRMRHTLIVPSELPEMSHWPSALNATEFTHDLWLLSVPRNRPVVAFHNFSRPSRLAVASQLPSGLKAPPITTPRCPRNACFVLFHSMHQ